MKHVHALIASALVASLGSLACAAVVNVSQTRVAQARSAFPFLTDSTTSVGPWSSSVSVYDDPAHRTEAGGTATQDSLVSDTRFAGTGTVHAQDYLQGTSGAARSSYIATFEVTAPTDYSLVGNWSVHHVVGTYTNPLATMRFERLSPNPTVYHYSHFQDWSPWDEIVDSASVNLAGTLPVGLYRFEVFVYQAIGFDPGSYRADGAFSFDLMVPSPGAIGLVALAGLVSLRRRR
jgi:hypothetical protein